MDSYDELKSEPQISSKMDWNYVSLIYRFLFVILLIAIIFLSKSFSDSAKKTICKFYKTEFSVDVDAGEILEE